MSISPATACCVIFNQQQQQNNAHHTEFLDQAEINQKKFKSKHCTVVENGLVVVKPLITVTSKIE